MDSFVQKSILAKLMATENMFIRQGNVSTASFDVKNRVLTVPVLDKNISKDLYDLFMGHECGHALWTSYVGMEKAMNSKINMSVLNVVEDSRIERKIKNKYPGIRAPFVRAYSELLEKDFFGTADKNLEEFNFIDRVNLHCKIGAHLAFKFTPEEKQLLNLVESTETFEDCVEVTKKICDYMKEQMEEEQKQRPKGDGEADENEEYEKGDENQSGSGSNQEEDIDGPSDNSLSEEDGEDKNDSGYGEKEKSSSGGSGGGAGRHTQQKENEIRSHTDDSYRKNEHNLFSKENNQYVYANVPVFDDTQIMDYKIMVQKLKENDFYNEYLPEKFNKYRQESAKVVSYLVKEFELRKNADQLKRAQIAKTGELNMSRIYSYNFAEDLFKKVTVMPQGKSHGLVMFIDWSGSMSKHLGNTVKQLMNLVLFCKKVNIPYEVYCFIDETYSEYNYREKTMKANDLALEQFALVNLLSSRMNAKDFTYAASALMQMSGCFRSGGYVNTPNFLRLGGTPLNEAVIAAMEIVPKFQKQNRLQVVNTVFLTDGEGSIMNRIHDKNGFTGSPNYTHMVIRDPKTNEEVIYNKKNYYAKDQATQTDALLQLLKLRTNSHVIGFFVGSLNEVMSRIRYFWPEETKEPSAEYTFREKIKAKFRQDNSLVAKSSGFDDYYILRSNGLDTDDEEELTFKTNATTRGMASAFSKYAGNKIASRVILNRFIGLIA